MKPFDTYVVTANRDITVGNLSGTIRDAARLLLVADVSTDCTIQCLDSAGAQIGDSLNLVSSRTNYVFLEKGTYTIRFVYVATDYTTTLYI